MARTYGLTAVPTPQGVLPGDRKVDGKFISEEACDRVRRYTTPIKAAILDGLRVVRIERGKYHDKVITPPHGHPTTISIDDGTIAYFEQLLPNGDACYTTIPNADGACRSFIRVTPR